MNSLFGSDDESATGGQQSVSIYSSELIPEVFIDRLDPHLHDDRFELWADIVNTSAVEVEITRVELFGTHNDPQQFLKPGEKREMKLYEGPYPDESVHKKAELHYETVHTNEYYTAEHSIEYKQEAGHDVPRRFRVIRPIRHNS